MTGDTPLPASWIKVSAPLGFFSFCAVHPVKKKEKKKKRLIRCQDAPTKDETELDVSSVVYAEFIQHHCVQILYPSHPV